MIINKNLVLYIVLLFNLSILSQTDWVRWAKSDPSYKIPHESIEREYDLSIDSPSDIVIKPLINAYWFLISDVDGANCPFHPTCSSFLVASIKETNIFQGTLMFFDRFTRDTNIIGRSEHYPLFGKYHFYDPIDLYTLKVERIEIIPAGTQVLNNK